ncbi:MAG: EAL domain-containing protein [Pseudomonadota bacterium]
MIDLDSEPQYRVLYLGETSVPARTALRALSTLPQITQIAELSDDSLLKQHLEAHRPHVVLLDVGMTDTSADRYACQQLLPLIEAPVIALTSPDCEQRGIRAVKHGAGCYLTTDQLSPEHLRRALSQSRDLYTLTEAVLGHHNAASAIIDAISDGAMLTNRDGRVLVMNAAARRLLGTGRSAMPGEHWSTQFCAHAVSDGSQLAEIDRPLMRLGQGDTFTDIKYIHRSERAEHSVFIVSGRPMLDVYGQRCGGMITFRDVTERFGRERQSERQSLYDPLTGIANRRLFRQQLQQALGRSERSQRTLGLLFVDLDRFRAVNDSLGHDIGDDLLKAAAERLQHLLRQGDLIARWRADTFVVAIENLTSPRDAVAAANKIVRGMAERFDCADNEVYISASVGIALHPEAGEDIDTLIGAADHALFQAKQQGGSRLQFHAPGAGGYDNNMAELEVGVRHALLRRELTLRFQPRVNLANGRLMGLETLLRWQHPRFGLLPPARFLSLLESSGLIHSVGQWVIRSVCAQLHSWQQRYQVPDLTVSINLSPMQLANEQLVPFVEQCIADYHLDPGCLEFELGDGAQCLQRPREIQTLKALRKIGVGIVLDHFGTHDISFSDLDSTVVSAFVLHQSLIQDVTDNEAHQRIVRAAIAMAEGLDIEISAEGVETPEQLDFLRQSRCTSAQGFYISRPMNSEKVSALLHSESLGDRLVANDSAA